MTNNIPIPIGSAVLTQVSFTNFDQVGICFATAIGTCAAANLIGDEHGECVSIVGWGNCYTP